MKPKKVCPNCGSNKVQKISYGLPPPPNPVRRIQPEYKSRYLGGCVIDDESPEWHCYGCEYEWGKYLK